MVKLVFFAPYPNILPVIQRVISERPESKDIQYQVVQDYYNNKLEHVDGDVIGPYPETEENSVCGT